MKTNTIMAVFLGLFIALSCSSQKETKEASSDNKQYDKTVKEAYLEYNYEIVCIQKNVGSYNQNLQKTISSGDTVLIWTAYGQLKEITNDALDKLNKMEGFEGDTTFLRAAKELMMFYRDYLKSDYEEYIRLNLMEESKDSEEINKRLYEIENKFSEGEQELHYNYIIEQKKLADKYDVELKKSE